LLGDALYDYIQANHTELLPYVTFRIGNPRAHDAGVRYIESDMNRSYNITNDTYEARQARELNNYIQKESFDLVLDLHTTVCIQPPCIIIRDITIHNLDFLRATSIDKIVLLQDPMVETTLAGVCAQAVAIEIANGDITPKLLEDLCLDLKKYIEGDMKPVEKTVYTVESLLLKAEVSPDENLTNFKATKFGYIPILTGENSYKKNTHYLGFKATKEERITL
jgi:succinylglutamate desuccinylase